MNTPVATINLLKQLWNFMTDGSVGAWIEWIIIVVLFMVLFMFVYTIANVVRADDQLFGKRADKALIRLDIQAAHVTPENPITFEFRECRPDEVEAIAAMFNRSHPALFAHAVDDTFIMLETRSSTEVTG